MAVSEGVRRLSLVLGLVVAIPWGLGTGVMCATMIWDSHEAWERDLQQWERDSDEFIEWGFSEKTTQTRRARVEAHLQRLSELQLSAVNAEIDSLSKVYDDAPILHLSQPTKVLMGLGVSDRPEWSMSDDSWGSLLLFCVSPLMFVISWSVVRVVAWVVEGFRRGPNPQ